MIHMIKPAEYSFHTWLQPIVRDWPCHQSPCPPHSWALLSPGQAVIPPFSWCSWVSALNWSAERQGGHQGIGGVSRVSGKSEGRQGGSAGHQGVSRASGGSAGRQRGQHDIKGVSSASGLSAGCQWVSRVSVGSTRCQEGQEGQGLG